jgi:hypothetical protein
MQGRDEKCISYGAIKISQETDERVDLLGGILDYYSSVCGDSTIPSNQRHCADELAY